MVQSLAVWVAAFLVLMPLVSLGAIALRGDDGIWPHLLRYVLPYAFWETLLLLTGIGICTGVIGVATAWLVTAYRFPGRAIVSVLLVLPLTMPTYITAYVYADLFDAFGPVQREFRNLFGLQLRSQYWFPEIRSLGGAIIVMSLVLYPYVYLSARAVFALQSGSMLDAARSLGSSASGIVRHVVVPLARPALAIGLSLVLLEALNDIGASDYFGVRTLTVTIANTWLSKGSLAGAAQIACLLLVLVFALVLLEARGRSSQNFALSSRRPCPVRAQSVSRRAGLLMVGFCLLPALLGFVVPFASLAFEAWSKFMLRGLSPDLWQAFWNSLAYAFLASLVTILLGFVLASVSRTDKRRQTRFLVRVAAMGYAVPGTVLAIGLLVPVAMLDRVAAVIMTGLGQTATGLIVTGSGAAVVLALSIRFLTIAVGSIEAGLSRVSPRVEEAARLLGLPGRQLLQVIHRPLARRAIAAAGLMVFVDCMKELPTTLLLRPLNGETLATLVYNQASRGSYEDGAIAALLIVLAGFLPILHLTRSLNADSDVARSDSTP